MILPIHAPPHPDGSEGLLAILVQSHQQDLGQISFFTDNQLTQQVACMRYPTGKVIERHRHLPVSRAITVTGEVLILRKGVIKLDIYSSYGEYVGLWILKEGDVAILVGGGHGLEVLDDAEILEVKQGPYPGRDKDKVTF